MHGVPDRKRSKENVAACQFLYSRRAGVGLLGFPNWVWCTVYGVRQEADQKLNATYARTPTARVRAALQHSPRSNNKMIVVGGTGDPAEHFFDRR